MGRETIIKSIREAVRQKNELPTAEAYAEERARQQSIAEAGDPSIGFVRRFLEGGGSLGYCTSEEEIAQEMARVRAACGNPPIGCASQSLVSFLTSLGMEGVELAQRETPYRMGVMLSESLLADSGGLLLTDVLGFGTAFAQLPPCLVLVAFSSQAAPDWEEALARLQSTGQPMPRSLTLLRPGEQVHLLLIEDQN